MPCLLAAVEWSTAFTAIGTGVVVIATTILTLRGNIASHWRTASEALEKRLDIALEEKAASEQQRDEQRQLKHDALNEVANLKARTDLEPILRSLADVQAALVAQRQEEASNGHALTAMLETMNATLSELTRGVRQLLDEREK